MYAFHACKPCLCCLRLPDEVRDGCCLMSDGLVRWGMSGGRLRPPRRRRKIFRRTSGDEILGEFFVLVRLWLGFACLLSALSIYSDESLVWLVFLGQLNVRRMSGDWIASVCRLRARASNYLPPILLSYFTGCIITLVDKIWACVAYLTRRYCWISVTNCSRVLLHRGSREHVSRLL